MRTILNCLKKLITIEEDDGVSLKEQFSFFIPLATTQFLIMITHSLFNAGLARLPAPAIYISAFAVAKSLMHLLQSPIMMVRQTVTSLISNQMSYYEVRKFVMMVVAFVVWLLIIFSFSGLSRWVFENIMGVTGDILDKSVIMLRILIFFPVAVTIRNFLQGVTIKYNMNPIITVATIARIIFVVLVIYFINKITFLSGAVIGGLMFLGAVIVEAVVIFVGSRLFIKNIAAGFDEMKNGNGSFRGTYIDSDMIFIFFWPLIVTSFLRTMAIPIINMGLARTVNPEIALSTFAVSWSVGMIILSPIFMFHQIPIYYLDLRGTHNFKAVKKFAIYMGLFLTICLIIISFTDIGYYIFNNMIGVNEQITYKSLTVLKVMILLPGILLGREFYWGLLLKRQKTKYISRGKKINIISLIIAVTFMTFISTENPAVIGIIGLIFCQFMEFIYLYLSTKLSKTERSEL